jgi:hypothetical protein
MGLPRGAKRSRPLRHGTARTIKRMDAVRRLAVQLMTEVFRRHRGMTHLDTDRDSDEHVGRPARTVTITRRGDMEAIDAPPVALQRVAARALVFDMRYLLLRMPRPADPLRL